MRRTRTLKTESGDFEQIENPQTGFDKVLNLVNDTPAKQYRQLLESLSQNFYFEKSVFQKTYKTEIPPQVKSEIKRKQVFKNYKKIMNFNNIQKRKQHFQNKNKRNQIKSAKKLPTLEDLLEKQKNHFLLQENLISIERKRVNNLLQDREKRQKVFQQALFLQRLFDIEQQEKLSQDVKFTIPDKFRGVNPKHMRINEEMPKEQDFHRRKHVYNQRKFQFFKHAMKIQNNSLQAKRKQNKNVLTTLLNFNKAKLQEMQKIDTKQKRMKKLFLIYSSSERDNPQNMYKVITKQSMKKLFKDFQIPWQENTELKEYLNTVKYIYEFEFLQIFHILTNPDGQFVSNINDYLNENIWPNFDNFIPEAWKKLKKYKKSLAKLIKLTKYQGKVQQIFRKKIGNHKDLSKDKLDFNEYSQIMWQIKLYPLKVNKKVLRFTYLYEKSHQYGINVNDLKNLFIIIGVYCGPAKHSLPNMKWAIELITGFNK